MSKPTCYARFEPGGGTVVWMRCPSCDSEIVIFPAPADESVESRNWADLRCQSCGMTPREAASH